MIKFIATALTISSLLATKGISHGLNEVRLIVTPNHSSLLKCKSNIKKILSNNGYRTSTRQTTDWVKIWGENKSLLISIQVECDKILNVKSVAVSHPQGSDSEAIETVINELSY